MTHIRLFIAASSIVLVLAFVGCAGQTSPAQSSTTEASSLIGTTSSSVQGSNVQKKSNNTVELRIGAEEYLSRALEEAEEVYETVNPSVTFARTIYKNSHELGELIFKKNTTFDALLCASREVMFSAEEAQMVDSRTRTALFFNPLALVTSSKNDSYTSFKFENLARGEQSVALMSLQLVEGEYAAQALMSIGCYNSPANMKDSSHRQGSLQSFVGTPIEGKGSFEDNIGTLVKKVESGEVDFGICFASDVERFPSLRRVCIVPQSLYDPIVTYGIPFSHNETTEAAQKFLNWCLTDDTARDIWTKWGIELAA